MCRRTEWCVTKWLRIFIYSEWCMGYCCIDIITTTKTFVILWCILYLNEWIKLKVAWSIQFRKWCLWVCNWKLIWNFSFELLIRETICFAFVIVILQLIGGSTRKGDGRLGAKLWKTIFGGFFEMNGCE